jgi:hypothetical protein
VAGIVDAGAEDHVFERYLLSSALGNFCKLLLALFHSGCYEGRDTADAQVP